MPVHPTVIRPETHAVFSPAGMGKSTVFASSRVLVGVNAFEPGQAHALHAHAGMDKVYHVVAGEGQFLLEGGAQPMRAGDLLVAPPTCLTACGTPARPADRARHPRPTAHVMNADGLIDAGRSRRRCAWCGNDPLYVAYHDHEWGRPMFDDRRLFEKICLEGFQSGLSWITILRKRERFREVFDGFDPARVARYGARDIARLLKDPGIVRHRGKIASTINNAKRMIELADEFGSLAAYAWAWEPAAADRPSPVTWTTLRAMPTTATSVALSKDLKRRGWTFVGPTTVYAFMQAMGLVNDHVDGCYVRRDVERVRGGRRARRSTAGPERGRRRVTSARG